MNSKTEILNLIVSGVEQRTQNTYELVFALIRNLANLCQQEHDATEANMDRFRESVQTLEFAGLNLFDHGSLKKMELKKIMDEKGLDVMAATEAEYRVFQVSLHAGEHRPTLFPNVIHGSTQGHDKET